MYLKSDKETSGIYSDEYILIFMKFIVSFLLIALFSFALGLYMPWWSVALSSFIVAVLIRQSSGRTFVAGFTGVFALWLIISWAIDASNHHLLATKVALILPFGGSAFLLILFTAFIGGLIGGMAALTGSLMHFKR